MSKLSDALKDVNEYVEIGRTVFSAIEATLRLINGHGKGEVTDDDFDREIEATRAQVRELGEKYRQRLSS